MESSHASSTGGLADGERSRRDKLSPQDLADLDSYANHLRAYYDIPPDQPVFPPRQRGVRRPGQADGKPKAAGTNSADHPWRGTL